MNFCPYIIFDFDGTLADTSSGIYQSFSNACASLQLDCPNIDNFKREIGPPIEELVLKIFPGLEVYQVQDFKALFRESYDYNDFKLFEWYEGVNSVLEILKYKLKIPLGIVTNKPTVPTENLIRDASLESFFDFIVGVDYLEAKGLGAKFQNKSEAIDYAISLIAESRYQLIYVGDTLKDYLATRNLNIRFIAATYGFYTWDMDSMACDSICDIEQLLSLLDG